MKAALFATTQRGRELSLPATAMTRVGVQMNLKALPEGNSRIKPLTPGLRPTSLLISSAITENCSSAEASGAQETRPFSGSGGAVWGVSSTGSASRSSIT